MTEETTLNALRLNVGLYTPCESCVDDWIDDPSWIGTVIVEDCGNGCCHRRENCIDCNGTGLVYNAELTGSAQLNTLPKE